MRSFAKSSRLVAENGLYLPSSVGGGGGDGPLPAATKTIVVNKGGNDGTGDGTDEKPFLTIGKAMTVAKTLGLSQTQLGLVLVGPGSFVEDVRMPPFVSLVSSDSSGVGTFVGTGSVGVPAIALDSVAWAPAVAAESAVVDILTNFLLGNNEGNVVIDFTGVASPGSFLLSNVGVAGSVTGIGDPAAGGNLFLASATFVDTDITVTGMGLEMSGGCGFFGTLTVAASATLAASANVISCAALVSFGSLGAVTLDATAGHNVTAFFDDSSVDGTLTLKDGGGGHTSYTATAAGIPSTVVLVGGAAPPVPTSPLVGLNSKNPTGVAAPAGDVATADGASGVVWSSPTTVFIAGLPIDSTGMTAFVNASLGVWQDPNAVPINSVQEWFDQTPSRAGAFWNSMDRSVQPGTFDAAGINGHPTIDTLESPNNTSYELIYLDGPGGGTFAQWHVKPDEFTLAATVLYTGTQDYQTTQQNPMIIGASQNGGGDVNGFGLTVGLDIATPGNVIFSVYANFTAATPPFFAQSISVPGNVAHYVVGTFKGGVLTIYLDAHAPVATAAVPPLNPANLAGGTFQTTLFEGGASTAQVFQGRTRAIGAWCVGQTGAVLAQTQLYFKNAGSL